MFPPNLTQTRRFLPGLGPHFDRFPSNCHKQWEEILFKCLNSQLFPIFSQPTIPSQSNQCPLKNEARNCSLSPEYHFLCNSDNSSSPNIPNSATGANFGSMQSPKMSNFSSAFFSIGIHWRFEISSKIIHYSGEYQYWSAVFSKPHQGINEGLPNFLILLYTMTLEQM